MTLPINQIICGDCLDVMKDWPDKCVDLVLTDPPYGIKISRKSNHYGNCTELSRQANGDSWDDTIPTKEYFDEIFRISRNQIIFGANYFWGNFYATSCYIVWDKREDLPDVPFCDTEFAWTSFNKMSKKYVCRNHGFIKDSKDIKTGHPTQKPSELFREIISDFSTSSDIILDPFCGSGTTCVAAELLGRKWIGIEISEDYCKIARRRVKEAQEQFSLLEIKR
jgi:site-specific DNA-methyltransferase (adenine-specific)